MDTQISEKNWAELKGKIKEKWSKFNEAEIESAKADLSSLGTSLQKTYGLAKEQADLQLDEFRKAVQALVSPVAAQAAASGTIKPAVKS
ncbi:MAG: hypothetical protein JNL01_16210 [Bdellovibrionales bacterium]|nr:hypothetical protein [Bdellovibrionales bacterium]